MGLHTGEPALGSEGYLGTDVVRAARLCTGGSGGHVLSRDDPALAGSSLPEGVSIFPLGERRLKDIDEPERIFELEIDGAPRPTARCQVASAGPDDGAGKTTSASGWPREIEARVSRSWRPRSGDVRPTWTGWRTGRRSGRRDRRAARGEASRGLADAAEPRPEQRLGAGGVEPSSRAGASAAPSRCQDGPPAIGSGTRRARPRPHRRRGAGRRRRARRARGARARGRRPGPGADLVREPGPGSVA